MMTLSPFSQIAKSSLPHLPLSALCTNAYSRWQEILTTDHTGNFAATNFTMTMSPKVAHLLDTKSFLMHIAQVEHSLGTVLLLRCQAVVNKCCFIINFSSKAIEMVIAKFQSSNSVTYQQKNNHDEEKSEVYSTFLSVCQGL